MKHNIQLLIRNSQADNQVASKYQFPMDDETLETLYQELQLPYEIDRTFFDYRVESPMWLQNSLGNENINIMELDYLAKRLDSFDKREMNTYVAVVENEGIRDMTDLINMTFHSCNYTLITDVSNLADVGETRYSSQHGCISLAELPQKYDFFCELGEDLLRSGTGIPTNFGILFPPENKEPMQKLYAAGGVFPTYDWNGNSSMDITITTVQRAEHGESPVTALLPTSQLQQDDLLLRMGIKDPAEEMVLVSVDAGDLTEIVDFTDVSLYDIESFAKALQEIEHSNYAEIAQIAELSGRSEDIFHMTDIANNFEGIIQVPSVADAEEYGLWLVFDSRKFSCVDRLVDEGLGDFLDFEKLGEHYKDMENGIFTENGYFGVSDPHFSYLLEPAEEMKQDEHTTGMEMQI